jgi:hypothetical protein
VQRTYQLCSRVGGHGLVAIALGLHMSIEYFVCCDQNGTDIKTRTVKLIHHSLDVCIMKKIYNL